MEGGPISPGNPSGQPPTRPITGTVLLTLDGRRVATATVGADGRFSVELPAGHTYGVQACTPSIQSVNFEGVDTPSCGAPVRATVQPAEATNVDLPPFIVP